MTKLREPPNTYQFQFKVGANGREKFHFVRDNDPAQLIYPNQDAVDSQDVPVRGPDAYGKDRDFIYDGDSADVVKLKLTVKDAHITFEMVSPSGVKIWQSIDGPGRHDYFVVGSFSEGVGVKMQPDTNNYGVFRYRGTTSIRDRELFSIIVDGVESLAYYPAAAGEKPGKSIVFGPGANVTEAYFAFDCWRSGVEYEIILNLEAEDKRDIVNLKWLTDPIDFDTMRDVVEFSLAEA
jgi:hypothetical protein